MAIGPISRTGASPIPESRSLVPVTPTPALPSPRAQVDAVERKAPRRQKAAGKVAERDRDTATAETATETAAEFISGDRSPATARAAGTGSAGQGRRDWSAPGSAPFVTQVLAQEVLKQGLYIEPWKQAVSAYERAAETAGPRLRYQMP
jgi:hypothetical protein